MCFMMTLMEATSRNVLVLYTASVAHFDLFSFSMKALWLPLRFKGEI